MDGDDLDDRIRTLAADLTPAQAAVARLVSEAPSVVAFGTVAEVAAEASTSPQTVLRLAVRLGHDGFGGLQDEVRSRLVADLPPAAARIRQRVGSDLPAEVLAADEANIAVSLDVDASRLDAAVDALLAAPQIGVVAPDSWAGIGALLAGHLTQLRPGVIAVDGPPPRVARTIAGFGPDDVVVAVDVRRYERWVVEAVAQATAGGATVIAVSDGPTSPLFGAAAHRFTVGVAGPGPFESAAGLVSLFHLLVTAVAARTGPAATARLDAIEAAWQTGSTHLP